MNEIKRLKKVRLLYFEYAKNIKNVRKTCRHFGISPTTYYKWLNRYNKFGEEGLKDLSKRPHNITKKTPDEIIEKILYLRRECYFGSEKIAMYLKRFHQFRISSRGIYCILKRQGLNRLPVNKRRRAEHTFRYEHSIPGCQLQIDVKFVKTQDNKKLYQFSAIDDFTRIRFMKIYPANTQKHAIEFLDYVLEKTPFRIYSIQTDNGPEFQTRFHWHALEKGLSHKYIKPRTPRLNGKIERSFKIDDEEFYKNLTILEKEHIEERLSEWENYYNFYRPHGSLNGLTPFERLKNFLYNLDKNNIKKVSTISLGCTKGKLTYNINFL